LKRRGLSGAGGIRKERRCTLYADGAANRRFRITKEDQCHAVSGRQAQQLVTLLCACELCGTADNLLEFAYKAGLLVHRQL
jgi:hypothetical protein